MYPWTSREHIAKKTLAVTQPRHNLVRGKTAGNEPKASLNIGRL